MSQQNKPNILVIMTDQQRRETVGSHPAAWIQTPHIDRIAREGVNFTRAYAECPICVPSRITFMTGKHAHEIDLPQYGSALDNGGAVLKGETTLPSILKAHHYHTAIVGKTHLAPYGCELGFEESHLLENSEDEGNVEYTRYLREHGFEKDDYWHDSSYSGVQPYTSRVPLQHYGETWVGEKSVDYIRQQSGKEQPFFLWTSFYKPHNPYNPPAPYHGRVDPESLPVPATVEPTKFKRGRVHEERSTFYESKGATASLNPRKIQEARARYCECVQVIDDQIGAIIDTLVATGQWENTAIIFVSDHGDMLGDHGHWHKTLAYESSAGVPLLLKAPGLPRGEQSEELASTIDLMPTCLELAGIQLPTDIDGISLLEAARQPTRTQREALYLECSNRLSAWHAVVYENWKYIHFINGGEEELYDLNKDPDELSNLAGVPAFDKQQQSMRHTLRNTLKAQGPDWALTEEGELTECAYQARHCRYTLQKD